MGSVAHAQQGIDVAGQIRTIQANDLITGQNKPGPYALAWNHFLRDGNHPVSVFVDGAALPEDAYTLDLVKGIITFNVPLKSTSLARVAYTYESGTAQRNADFLQAPITVPLMRAAGTDLQLTALPDNVTGDGTTKLVYGLNRQTNLLGGGLTSKALVANDGSSLNFGYKYGNAANGFDAGFQRTEREFASHVGKSLNLATPNSGTSLGAHLRPANYFGFGATLNDQHDLAADSDVKQHGLNLNLGGFAKEPALNLARVVAVTDKPQTAPTDVTTDKVDLTAKVGDVTALTAKGQRVATDAPGAASDTTAQDASVGLVAASKDKKRSASVSVTDSTNQTATMDNQSKDFQIKFQPVQSVVVSAEQKDTKTEPIGSTTTPVTSAVVTSVGAELTPLQATKLTGTLRTNVQGDTHTDITDLNAQVGAGKAIELGGGITNRSAEAGTTTPSPSSTLDTRRASVALRPFKAFTLSGGYVWNPEKDGTVTDAVRQDIGFNAHLGALDFGSAYSLTTLNGLNVGDLSDPQYGQVNLTLGLRFSQFTTLKGNYQDYLSYGTDTAIDGTALSAIPTRGSRIYGLNLTHTLGPALNVSMNGTVTQNYAIAKPTPDYKAQATIGAKF